MSSDKWVREEVGERRAGRGDAQRGNEEPDVQRPWPL